MKSDNQYGPKLSVYALLKGGGTYLVLKLNLTARSELLIPAKKFLLGDAEGLMDLS